MLIKKMTVEQALAKIQEQKRHQVDSPYPSRKLDKVDIDTLNLTIEQLEGFQTQHGGEHEVPEELAEAVNKIPYNKTVINTIHNLVVIHYVKYQVSHKSVKEPNNTFDQSPDKKKISFWSLLKILVTIGVFVTLLVFCIILIVKMPTFENVADKIITWIDVGMTLLSLVGGGIAVAPTASKKKKLSPKFFVAMGILLIALSFGLSIVLLVLMNSPISSLSRKVYVFFEIGMILFAVIGWVSLASGCSSKKRIRNEVNQDENNIKTSENEK